MVRFLFAFFLLGISLCEARVVSFEAVSHVSAEEADRQALAGIALQIRARVNTSHQTVKSEISGKNRMELHTDYSERIDVRSDVLLDGVEFHRETLSDGRWKSTAVFDTEKATKASRLALRRIQADAQDLKGKMESFTGQGNFDEALRILESLELLFGKFQKIYSETIVLEPLDESYRFGVDVYRLMEGFAFAIKDLKMSFARREDSVSHDTLRPFVVLVENSQGVVKNLAVTASIEGKNAGTVKTDSSGKARFFLDVEKLPAGNHEIVFQIRCPKFNRENSNLELRTSYFSKAPMCAISLVCSENAEICATGKELLEKAGFQTKQDAEKIHFRIIPEKRNVFEVNFRQIVRTEFSMELVGVSVKFSKWLKGTGVSELQAQKKAIRKINPEEIRSALLPLCKGQ